MWFKFKKKDIELAIIGVAKVGDTVVLQSERKLSLMQKREIFAQFTNLHALGIHFLLIEPPLKGNITQERIN